jgi:RNA polymerase sigma factor (sigma-70 family)
MVDANQPTTRTRFATDSDEDLIFYMSVQSEDRATAEEAWEEFFFRYREYVLGVCRRFRGILGDLGVEDLAKDTLVRVFEKAHTFKPLNCGNNNRERARICAWMGRIANNLFFSSLRRQPTINFVDTPQAGGRETPTREEVCNEPAESSQRALLREALDTLNEREREILLTSYAWYEPGVGCQRMPTEELEALTERFHTTPANIRQIRTRALDKLKHYVADHNNQ